MGCRDEFWGASQNGGHRPNFAATARRNEQIILEDEEFPGRCRRFADDLGENARIGATCAPLAIITAHSAVVWIVEENSFATILDFNVAIAKSWGAGYDGALRIRTTHIRIRRRTSHSTSATIVYVARGIRFASGLCVHIAIEFAHDAAGNLASSCNTSGNGIRSFARIAAHPAMIGVCIRIGFTTILVEIIAISPIGSATRDAAHPRDTTDGRIDGRGADVATHPAMIAAGRCIRFANCFRIPIAFEKACWTAPTRAARASRPARRKVTIGRRTARSYEKNRAKYGPSPQESPKLAHHERQGTMNLGGRRT